MIDIHAHLCFPQFNRDRNEIIKRCRQELRAVIVGTARYEECLKALELCKTYEGFLFPTLGFHPTEEGSYESVVELIKERRDEIVGIGEVGMDYHWVEDEGKRREQRRIFEEFITLAENLRKPLVIHSWDAENDCFEMLKGTKIPCIFHSFSGKKELAAEIIRMDNMFISFSTQILFSKKHKKLAKIVPLDRMLLETDSPFLAPDKSSDPRNYPWNIKLSASKIAKVKGIDVEDVLLSAERNAVNIFGLEERL